MLTVREFVSDSLNRLAMVFAVAGIMASGQALAQPANDNFDAAIELPGDTGVTNGTIASATVEAGEPQYHGVGPNSVWYRWTAPRAARITFDTVVPSIQTVVAAYVSTNPVPSVDSLRSLPLANAAVAGCVTFNAQQGVTYYIQVLGNLDRFPGDFVLHWMPEFPAPDPTKFAGEFRFVSRVYSVTEYESSGSGFRPVDPTSTQRSALGAVVTVTRLGGSAGRAMVDYRTMDEISTNFIATVITSITNVTPDDMDMFFTNQGNIVTIFTNIYQPSSFLLSNVVSTFSITRSNICPEVPCIEITSSTNCNDFSSSFACPIRPGFFGGDYTRVSGTLYFDEFETTKRFLVPVASDFFRNGNKQLRLELFNPRLDNQELLNPSELLPPTRNCTNSTATLVILEQITQFNGGTNFFIERTSYAVNEGAGSINIDILLPSAGGGNVIVDVSGSDDEPRYIPSVGSDYATDTTQTFINPLFTDGTFDIATTQDFSGFTTNITFPQNQPRATITIPITDDNEVEFNEDIFVRLRQVANQPPIGPNISARVTILDNDQPAGALDRDWNPDNVSFTTPRFNLTPGANNIVRAVAVQADQRTIIGGDFTAYNSTPRNGIARINLDGSLDPGFNPGTGSDGFVAAVAVYPTNNPANSGKVVVGGGFSSIDNVLRNGIARLDVDGSLDASFNPGRGANGAVYSLAIQNDGKVLLAGDFTQIDGVARNGVARLNPDGSVDSAFDPGLGPDGTIWSVAVRDTAQTVFAPRAAQGNEFEDVNVIETGSRQGVITVDYDFLNITDNIRVYYDGARIFNLTTNGVGQLVIPFGPGASTKVTIILNEGTGLTGTLWAYIARISVPPPERTIFIGGEFLTFNGQYRSRVARLRDNGTLDVGFDPGGGADGPVYAVTPQADGRLLIGGWFSSVDFRPRNNLARLEFNGAIDGSYDPGTGPNDAVFAIATQADGKAIIGGVFTSVNSTRRLGVARLFLDGSLDTSFMDTAYNQFAGLINTFRYEPPNYVNAVAIQADGAVMIGGSFNSLGGNYARNAVNTQPWVGTFFWPVAGINTAVSGWQRADKHPRYNVARLIGGYTPGPGNIEYVYDYNTTDEHSDVFAVALQRVDGRLGTVSARPSTLNNLAAGGTDFEGLTFALTWPENARRDEPLSVGSVGERFFDINIYDDPDIEGDELFGLRLTQPVGSINLNGELIPLGAALRRAASTANIIDNDFKHGTFAFSAGNFPTNENAGTNIITVVRTNGSSGQVTVRYFTQNGTAMAGPDYTAMSGTLTFASGVTTQYIRVPIFNDTSVEPDESFTIVLTNATGGATLPGGTAASTATATATIIDNDLLSGRANFASATYATNEGAGLARITLVRLGGSVGELSVSAAATAGTATAGSDFTAVTNTITWVHADIAPKTLLVPLVDDSAVESNKTVALRIFNPSVSGGIGSVSNATLNILEDDFYGALSFSQPIFDADERGSNVTVTVLRTGGVGDTVSVDYRVENDTAVNGVDFVATNGTLIFGPGVTASSFQIVIRDDGVMNGDRLARLVLANFNRATSGATPTATLRIFDDESISDLAGSLDTSFDSQAGGTNAIHGLVLQPWDTNILVAGEFRTMNRVPRNRVARMRPDGALDTIFNNGPGPNAPVRSMALQPDGRILIGGFFTSVHGTNRNYIARLLADGSVDRFFNPGAGADNPVYALALQADGRILVGGSFASFNGVSSPGIALLESDGTVSSSFNAGQGANGTVFALAVQTDGKILVGGDFTRINGIDRPHLARLNRDGSVDQSFSVGAGPNGAVRAITVQPDGKILIGGAFTDVNGSTRNFLARLESSGALDNLFLASVAGGNDEVSAIALQFDGKIIVAGEFTRFNGVSRGRITRLDQAGRTDPTINFGEAANDVINTAVIQPDRKILIGGRFTAFDGHPRNLLARLHGGSIAGPGNIEFISAYLDVLESADEAEITVVRRGGLSGAVDVTYATEALPNSATPSQDYSTVTGTLTFPEGETHRSFVVPILDDSIGEQDEPLLLRLSNPTSGAGLGNVPNALLTILNDDSGLGLSSATYTVNENVAGGNVIITVLRIGATNGTARVNFATANGTAIAGQDYVATNGLLTFAPGQTVQTFSVAIIDDPVIESTEAFGVTLSNATGSAPPNPATATVSIIDNDIFPGDFSFSATAYSVPESAPSVAITILRTNGFTGVISVRYFTSDDTATGDIDYATSTDVVLSFAESESSRTINIPIFNDGLVEGNERFFITLTNASQGSSIVAPVRVPITIQDDDIAPGSVDGDFDPGVGPNALVRSVAAQPDGRIVIGGAFTFVSGTNRPYVAQLLANGPLDPTFDPGTGPNAFVSSVGVLPDRRVLIGGSFNFVAGSQFNRVARLHTGGSPDVNFNQSPGFNGVITTLATKEDGRFVVGGSFTLPTRAVTQLRSDGTIDTAFNPGEAANAPVHAVFVQEDGRVIIGGAFTAVDGQPRTRVARFNLNGFLDDSFVPLEITNGTVFCLAQQTDGKVIAGGDFMTSAGTNRVTLVRLNTDGTIDNSFAVGSGPNDVVYDLIVQPTDKIILGGAFTAINGLSRPRFARLTSTGDIDASFDPGVGANNTVFSLALLPGGELIIAGDFTEVRGVVRNRVARIFAYEPPPVEFTDIVVAVGTNPRLTITATPGRTYVLQKSSDLQNWTPITTNSAASSTLELVDPQPPNDAQRFYRALER